MRYGTAVADIDIDIDIDADAANSDNAAAADDAADDDDDDDDNKKNVTEWKDSTWLHLARIQKLDSITRFCSTQLFLHRNIIPSRLKGTRRDSLRRIVVHLNLE